MGPKLALAAMSCLVFIAHSAAADLTIDGFEEGPFMFSDVGRVGAGPVESEPYGTDTSREQAGLAHVRGGVRLVTLGAHEAITAALVPIEGADNGLMLSWVSYGTATLTYDGAAGGLASSGSAGALDLDLRALDSIVVEVSVVDVATGGPLNLSVFLSDSVRTGGLAQPVQPGVNTFPLSDINVDLGHIRQIQLRLAKQAGGAASVRVLDISAVSNPSPGSGLPAPSLLTPASGSTVPSAASPQFTWSAVSGATGYRIAVVEYPGALPEDPAAPGCTGCAIHATTTAPAHTQLSALPGGRVYRWRAQALPAGRWSDPGLFSTAGSVALQITSPAPGSTVEAASVIVRGVVTPPPGIEVGVEVNGSLALVGPGKFGATVRVDDTVKVLVATARDSSGAVIARQAIPVSVNVPEEGPKIRLSVAPDMGTTPFTAHFGFSSDVSLVAITLDADGNGVPDYAGQTFDDVSFTYQVPGLYEARVTAVAEDGTVYTDSELVRVFTTQEIDLLLKPKWDAVKNALRSGNVAGAVQHVLIRRRADYTASLNSLAIPLSNIDQELTSITFERQLSRNVDYQMQRVEDGTTYSYPVVFTLDEDGIWRLSAF